MEIKLKQPIEIGSHKFDELVDMSRFQTDVHNQDVEMATRIVKAERGIYITTSLNGVRRQLLVTYADIIDK